MMGHSMLGQPGITKIYLDLDDVLNTFTVSFLQRYRCEISDLREYPRECGYSLARALVTLGYEGCLSEIWDLPENFWAFVPPVVDAGRLCEVAGLWVGRERVSVLTRPTHCSASYSGKIRWARRNLPEWLHRRVEITHHKHERAEPGALLIDDNEENCRAFAAAGGRVLLWPRPWNSAWDPYHWPDAGYLQRFLASQQTEAVV